MKNIKTPTKRKIYPLLITILILVPLLLPACKSQTPVATAPQGNSSLPPDRVDVVCFYRSDVCHCLIGVNLRLQHAVLYTVETYFQDELASGRLTHKDIRWEDKENAAIVNKYNALPLSLFINEVRGGNEHIEAWPEIWTLLSDEDDTAFVEALKTKIEKSLKGEV